MCFFYRHRYNVQVVQCMRCEFLYTSSLFELLAIGDFFYWLIRQKMNFFFTFFSMHPSTGSRFNTDTQVNFFFIYFPPCWLYRNTDIH